VETTASSLPPGLDPRLCPSRRDLACGESTLSCTRTVLVSAAVTQDLDFYSTAAQVIPLIFFTLAIDMKGFVESPLETKRAAWHAVRRETEPKLRESTEDYDVAVEQARRQQRLTPEESLAVKAESAKKVAASFDSVEVPLEDRARRGRVVASVLSLIAIFGLILGEAVALRVLESGEGGHVESGIVESALWLGAWLVAWRLVDRYLGLIGKEIPTIERSRAWWLASLTGVVLAMTYIAWHAI
jgi:hypothetical protein